MTLIHYNKPNFCRSNGHSGLRTFNEMMDELFETGNHYYNRSFIPAANVFESNKDYRIELAVPGLKRDQIKVTLDDDVLKLHTDVSSEQKKEEYHYRFEFDYSNFERTFTIPDTVEREKISARYNDGILQVVLPKREDHINKGPKEINIK
jgi:HSP20 family protein